MSEGTERVDLLVLGGGPSGQKAAIQGAKLGKKVLLIDRSNRVGGECVHRGTIPSKTLRENAVYLSGLRARSEGLLDIQLSPDMKVSSLMRRLRKVLSAHEDFISAQMERNDIEVKRGHARFLSNTTVRLEEPGQRFSTIEADVIVIATGSRPRDPEEIPIDHEHVLDSDSVLSMIYLPESMTVLGGGVIATEFASTFAALGVKVTMVDRNERPLAFLEKELTDLFLESFAKAGGRFLSGRKVESVEWDGMSTVFTELEDGQVLSSQKLLCAMGRIANVHHLGLEQTDVELGPRGHVEVDEHCRTCVPHIYAVGDVIGPPALAATAVAHGRQAVRHAFGLEGENSLASIPIGIYSIPEIASVGLKESEAIERYGSAMVGSSSFHELARGQINGNVSGLLRLVSDGQGRRLLGAHIVGEGATELIHVAQMAICGGLEVDAFLENVFNFPTLAEAYRVAAIDIIARRPEGLRRVA